MYLPIMAPYFFFQNYEARSYAGYNSHPQTAYLLLYCRTGNKK